MSAPDASATTPPAEIGPAASRRWASAAVLIRAEHAAVMALYRKARPETSRSTRQATMRRLCLALEVHARLEEEIFYPALRGLGLPAYPLDGSPAQHGCIRAGIERLRAAGDPEMEEHCLHSLMNDFMHHMADEETLLLPQAQRALGDQGMRKLGARMFRLRLALSREHAGEMAPDTAHAAPAKTGPAAALLVGLTRWWLGARPRLRQVFH